jgi:hypothetical protein
MQKRFEPETFRILFEVDSPVLDGSSLAGSYDSSGANFRLARHSLNGNNLTNFFNSTASSGGVDCGGLRACVACSKP